MGPTSKSRHRGRQQRQSVHDLYWMIVQSCPLVLCFCIFFCGLCSGGGLIQQPLQSQATSLNPFPLREDKGQKQSYALMALSDGLSPPPVFLVSRSAASGRLRSFHRLGALTGIGVGRLSSSPFMLTGFVLGAIIGLHDFAPADNSRTLLTRRRHLWSRTSHTPVPPSPLEAADVLTFPSSFTLHWRHEGGASSSNWNKTFVRTCFWGVDDASIQNILAHRNPLEHLSQSWHWLYSLGFYIFSEVSNTINIINLIIFCYVTNLHNSAPSFFSFLMNVKALVMPHNIKLAMFFLNQLSLLCQCSKCFIKSSTYMLFFLSCRQTWLKKVFVLAFITAFKLLFRSFLCWVCHVSFLKGGKDSSS